MFFQDNAKLAPEKAIEMIDKMLEKVEVSA